MGAGSPRIGRSAAAPWWLAEEELCPGCLQGYAATSEVRCGGCDEAVCAWCTVRVDELLLCSGCASGEAAAGEPEGAA